MAQCRVKGHAVTLTGGSVQSSWPDRASCRSQKKKEGTLIVFLPFFMLNPGKREGNSGRHIILHARHCLFGGQCCQTHSPSDPARPCSQSRRRPSPATHHPQLFLSKALLSSRSGRGTRHLSYHKVGSCEGGSAYWATGEERSACCLSKAQNCLLHTASEGRILLLWLLFVSHTTSSLGSATSFLSFFFSTPSEAPSGRCVKRLSCY